MANLAGIYTAVWQRERVSNQQVKCMNDLTIPELKEKIERVKQDLESLRMTGDASRKLEILSEYKKYLEDDLKILQKEQRNI